MSEDAGAMLEAGGRFGENQCGREGLLKQLQSLWVGRVATEDGSEHFSLPLLERELSPFTNAFHIMAGMRFLAVSEPRLVALISMFL